MTIEHPGAPHPSPAPIDSAKVEDTGEPVADEREAFRSWFRTSGFWNDAITEKAWIAACKWQREQLAPTVTMQGGNEALPTNKALERFWEDHAGHPADFGASVLEKWGGWPAGALGYGAPRLPNTTPSTQAVGEPWQAGDDTSSVQISRDGSTHKWGCKCEGCVPTTGSAPEMTNGDFHCPACGEVKKGPLFCGNCLWQAPEAIDAEIDASPAASVRIPTQLEERAMAGDDTAIALLAETHGAGVAWANEPNEFHHIIEFTPPQLRALLTASMGGDKS